jgi:site-specific DNA-methyltransferase (adenine-specific)
MTVQILIGDMRDRLKELADCSIDCVLTDPPYGETSLVWDRWPPGWPALVRRVLKPTGSMWVFGSQRMFWEHVGEFVGWKLAQDVVWEKHNGTGLFNDRFRRVHETALHLYLDDSKWSDVYKEPQFTNDATARTVRKKGRPAQWIGATGETVYKSEDGGPRLMRSVMFVRSEHGRAEHPTQKPIGIVEPLLLYSCPVGGTVLDCFAGSGTTAVVAVRHNRNCILIEGRPEFAAIAEQRLRDDAPLFSYEAAQ